jgi:hypothetical protein
MSAEVRLQPLTEHGSELLNELEHSTHEFPVKIEELSGARTYYLSSGASGVDALDAELEWIDPDWREHVARTQ